MEFNFPLILGTLFFHYVLISSEVFFSKFTSQEVEKHNGNFMAAISYSFPRVPVSHNIFCEVALVEVLHAL